MSMRWIGKFAAAVHPNIPDTDVDDAEILAIFRSTINDQKYSLGEGRYSVFRRIVQLVELVGFNVGQHQVGLGLITPPNSWKDSNGRN